MSRLSGPSLPKGSNPFLAKLLGPDSTSHGLVFLKIFEQKRQQKSGLFEQKNGHKNNHQIFYIFEQISYIFGQIKGYTNFLM